MYGASGDQKIGDCNMSVLDFDAMKSLPAGLYSVQSILPYQENP